MKKILLSFLAIIFLIALVSCTSKEETTTTTEETTTTSEETTTDETTTTEEDTSAPTFSGTEDITINWGEEFDLLDGVSASDEVDGDLTDSITTVGTVDIYKHGSHQITYSVTNSQSIETTVERKVKVNQPTIEQLTEIINDEEKVTQYEEGNNLDLSIDGSSSDGIVEGWGSWGMGGPYYIENGIMTFETGTEYFQVSNGDNDFKIDQRYIVLFDIKSDNPHTKSGVPFTFRTIVGSEEDGWDDFHIQYFENDITTETQTFGFVFKSEYETKNVILWASEHVDNTLYLSNIQIYEFYPEGKELTNSEPPVINGTDNTEIEWGTEFGLLDGVSATDDVDGDITSSITTDGTIDKFTPGEYTITYKVTDSDNQEATETRIIKVLEPTTADLIAAANDDTIVIPYGKGTNLDLSINGNSDNGDVPGWGQFSFGVGGPFRIENEELIFNTTTDYYQVTNGGNAFTVGQRYIVLFDVKADNLHVKDDVPFTFRTIIGSEENGWDDYHIQLFDNDVTTDYQTFAFIFNAEYATENVLLFASEHVANTIYIRNINIYEFYPEGAPLYEAPEFEGLNNVEIPWGTDFDLLDGVSATDDVDGDITSSITTEGTLDILTSGEYTITYKVTDSDNQEATETRIIKVLEPTTADLIAAANDDTIVSPYEGGNNLDLSIDGNSNEGVVEGWSSFSFTGAGGPYSISNGELIINTPVDYYQVANGGNNLNLNQQYIVLFDIKADNLHHKDDVPFTFRTIVGSEENGWDDYHIQLFENDITTQTQTFAFLFTAKYETNNVLAFITEHVENTIYISNIQLLEITSQ